MRSFDRPNIQLDTLSFHYILLVQIISMFLNHQELMLTRISISRKKFDFKYTRPFSLPTEKTDKITKFSL